MKENVTQNQVETEKAYAKVNLFLDVLRKREDGYHDLGTFFQTINIYDELSFQELPNDAIELVCNESLTKDPEENLVVRAARLLQKTAKIKRGVQITLKKELPAGAGLGGGSADAAATLRALNRLWNLHFSAEKLEKLGRELGADVPFMIRGGSSFAEGIGEILSPAPTPKDATILVATPKEFVSTPQAYANISPAGDSRWLQFRRALQEQSNFFENSHLLFNCFEQGVYSQFPKIKNLAKKLEKLGGKPLLSGSGASVFAIFEKKEVAEMAFEHVKMECRYSILTHWKKSISNSYWNIEKSY